MDTISIPKISKGNNSATNVGGVTVVNLCTSSDHALHLYQVIVKLSQTVSKLWTGHECSTADGRTDGRTDRQTDGQTLKSSEGIT